MARERIEDSLWAFRSEFILSHSKVEMDPKYLSKMQGDLSEDANDLVRSLINDMDYFVEDAIRSDGRGYFIASYDSEENEQGIDGVYYFIYRTN